MTTGCYEALYTDGVCSPRLFQTMAHLLLKVLSILPANITSATSAFWAITHALMTLSNAHTLTSGKRFLKHVTSYSLSGLVSHTPYSRPIVLLPIAKWIALHILQSQEPIYSFRSTSPKLHTCFHPLIPYYPQKTSYPIALLPCKSAKNIYRNYTLKSTRHD